MVAVAQVQPGEQRHLPTDQTQGRVSDVQPRQPQVLHIPQFAAVVQLAWWSHDKHQVHIMFVAVTMVLFKALFNSGGIKKRAREGAIIGVGR